VVVWTGVDVADSDITHSAGGWTIATSGLYRISYNLYVGNNGSTQNENRAVLRVDTFQAVGSLTTQNSRANAAGAANLSASVILRLTAGQVVDVVVRQIVGSGTLEDAAFSVQQL
jgi:hypothetical protein